VIIREYEGSDLGALMRVHEANGLPANCFPELVIADRKTHRLVLNPLFIVREVGMEGDEPAVAGFVKLTGEAFIILNHAVGDPEKRWEWLQQITDHCERLAWARGLDELTAWIPPDLVDSFEKRLKDLGFERSPWVSFTKKLT
jgi:hypothetical protein